MGKDGFLEGLIKDWGMQMSIESSRDSGGAINPYAAAAISSALGNTSDGDMARLGELLGSSGAFGAQPRCVSRAAVSAFSVSSRYCQRR